MNKNIRFAFLLLVSLFAVSANSAPMAYSVNSDSLDGDSLYLIDLATGVDQMRGKLDTGLEFLTDTEGLAFAPDPDGNHPNGNLWGIDDPLEILFPVSAANGTVDYREQIQLPPLPAGPDQELIGGNDFGMTFACDNTLYFTSVKSQSLFQREPEGGFTIVGAVGALGVNISAIAAIGNPTKLYGIGNGLLENGTTDAPNLYSINTTTGVASMIGPLSDTNEFKYNEAGLAFDSEGGLWAITDRSQIDGQKSQILSIDVAKGYATLVAETVNEIGYESLAIAPPAKCSIQVELDADYEPIPSLNLIGRISAVLILMLAGMLFLRRRYL
jgi:hypothetical protein